MPFQYITKGIDARWHTLNTNILVDSEPLFVEIMLNKLINQILRVQAHLSSGLQTHQEQESIPVGCVPPVFVVPWGMMPLPVWSHVPSGGVWFQEWGLVPSGGLVPGDMTLPSPLSTD